MIAVKKHTVYLIQDIPNSSLDQNKPDDNRKIFCKIRKCEVFNFFHKIVYFIKSSTLTPKPEAIFITVMTV